MDPHQVSRIAVIAVHGVGDQGPNTTARDLAGLLQRASPQIYSEFTESQIELPVAKPQLAPGPAPVQGGREAAPMFVRSRYARLRSASEQTEPEDIAFTRRALADVEVDDELSRYRSVRLSGIRSSGAARTQVDIYELYWADLSRLGGWFVRVLAEVYQILFHVASLGQKTVELAWLKERAHRGRLAWVLRPYAIAEWSLAVGLPVSNLALLLAIAPLLLLVAPDTAGTRAALCGLFAAGVFGYLSCLWIWRKARNRSATALAWMLGAAVFAALIIGGVAGYFAYQEKGTWPRIALHIALSGVGLLVFWWLAIKLDRRRRLPESDTARGLGRLTGPGWAAVLATAVWLACLAIGLLTAPFDVVQSAMLTGEAFFVLVELSWIFFIAAAWFAFIAGAWAWVKSPRQVKAALWTGKIGLLVPGALLFVLNLVAWNVAGYVAKQVIKPAPTYQSVLFVAPDGSKTWDAHQFMDHLIAFSATGGFNIFIVVMVLAILLLLVGMLHSIIHESNPTVGDDADTSALLGNWLDAGFKLARVAAYLMAAALLVVVPVSWLYTLFAVAPENELFKPTLLPLLGGLVIAGAGVAVTMRAAIFEGLSKAFDIAFDVDNWLKERPVARNPRGRILLRYLALLEHVRAKGYDRLVIVTHSQGTVITADLLRYLYATRQPKLPPLTLMTFGSPLRQLYGERFPHLYGWARGENLAADIPDRASLAAERWINAYRSGDYVGRYFWTPANWWQPRVGIPPQTGKPLTFEFCVGAGAHTHYFDETATFVGTVIDGELAPKQGVTTKTGTDHV